MPISLYDSRMKFSKNDTLQLKEQGIPVSKAAEQIERLKKGFPFVQLLKPCTAGDGIFRLDAREQKTAENKFHTEVIRKTVLKFVPASGAASRMFQFLEDKDAKHDAAKQKFLEALPQFAFYSQLSVAVKKNGYDIAVLRRKKDLKTIVSALLEKDGLGYREAPKGMILFHGRGKNARTAFEEQLDEARIFADKKKTSHLHFTLPPAARKNVRLHLKQATRGAKFVIGDSIQSPASECLAMEKNGKPVRSDKDSLLLRPSGHGALLENLNRLKADLIYVKNIDNILPAVKRKEADRWKKILTGFFIFKQEEIFRAQAILAQKKMQPRDLLFTLVLAQELGWDAAHPGAEGSRKSLEHFFNRPFRVCAMVPNAGEPGGGPFWIRDSRGKVSAQIIESAEVNLKDKAQEKIWRASTHFNPVDFVCGVYDCRGKKYNLPEFRDPERGLIAEKSYQGRSIRVMELPGLWNGSMADWLTVFVEVPGVTFAPVKTVLDLIRKEHQVKK
ncbi:MAG TPA: DUF4301 domain-containing protein [Candidatus Omnitrophica bacterium]|nr:DUF4301 domain-containing protein [Candidatus Omnitrophota bacterium]